MFYPAGADSAGGRGWGGELSVLSQWGASGSKSGGGGGASQLRKESSFRIQRELQGYFGDPPTAINRLNATAFRMGDLDVLTASRGETMLFSADADLSQHCFCVLR